MDSICTLSDYAIFMNNENKSNPIKLVEVIFQNTTNFIIRHKIPIVSGKSFSKLDYHTFPDIELFT